ncbi:MAG TPA: glycerol kinase GlpK [Polyangiaceae bacterium]
MTANILAIDQGTTGTTVMVLGSDGTTRGKATREFPQHFPRPGWVEHDPDEIWASVVDAFREALREAGIRGADVGAIGITNQRETTLLWDRRTDAAVHPAIVWQDRRTADFCRELQRAGHEEAVVATTGLVLDPYFSATKLRWMLDLVDGAKERANAGELAFGTVDSYLVWRLAGGGAGAAPHVTDVTNASRTLLMDLGTRTWSATMCDLMGIPKAVLPTITPSAGRIATTRALPELPDGIPISGVAGDQHAALFGQGCFAAGEAKCTYGTGAFLLVNTGSQPTRSHHGLLSTLGWQIGDQVVYALEGSCFVAGAAVQWLRDGLGLIRTASEIEPLAGSVTSTGGVVFVPALAGLGAPHWDPSARGLICGLTRGTTRAHLARAVLESIALEVNDVLTAMADDLGRPISRMRVDGGAAANDLLMQLQADISAVLVERPAELETTARGAAMLAGIGAGLFAGGRDAAKMVQIEKTFGVDMNEEQRNSILELWRDAIRRARGTGGPAAAG